MRSRIKAVWLILFMTAGVFSLAYLWYSFFPGEPDTRLFQYFSAAQVQRGREYQRALQLASIINIILEMIMLAWLVFSGRAVKLAQRIQHAAGGRYWRGVLVYTAVLWALFSLVSLPFSFFGGYCWQKRWGFYTQGVGGWWLDYLKGAGIEMALFLAGIAVLFMIMRKWPKTWWAIISGLFSVWLVVQTLLWPVVISPLFNEFVPAGDPGLVAMVRDLSDKAGIPVGQVLIMDASRRTTKANAYFSGLGKTKRIVLYDNLLSAYPPDEVRAVVAHEIAHWQQRHILEGLGWGIAGSFIVWGLVYLLVAMTTGRIGSRDRPHVLTVIMLGLLLISYLGSPVENAISRTMEEEADTIAVRLTGDAEAAIRLQVDLATKNLSELSPAGFIEWFSYSHPSVLARIDVIEKALK